MPEVSLNFSALTAESLFDRDVIEGCVRETLILLLRAIATQRSVLFTFKGIGVLVFRNSKVKMHFSKDFLSSMDGGGGGRALSSLGNVSITLHYTLLMILSRTKFSYYKHRVLVTAPGAM